MCCFEAKNKYFKKMQISLLKIFSKDVYRCGKLCSYSAPEIHLKRLIFTADFGTFDKTAGLPGLLSSNLILYSCSLVSHVLKCQV